MNNTIRNEIIQNITNQNLLIEEMYKYYPLQRLVTDTLYDQTITVYNYGYCISSPYFIDIWVSRDTHISKVLNIGKEEFLKYLQSVSELEQLNILIKCIFFKSPISPEETLKRVEKVKTDKKKNYILQNSINPSEYTKRNLITLYSGNPKLELTLKRCNSKLELTLPETIISKCVNNYNYATTLITFLTSINTNDPLFKEKLILENKESDFLSLHFEERISFNYFNTIINLDDYYTSSLIISGDIIKYSLYYHLVYPINFITINNKLVTKDEVENLEQLLKLIGDI